MPCKDQLSTTFYDNTCPNALATIHTSINAAVGGPSWTVRLGRRDSTTSNTSQPLVDLPIGVFNLSLLISRFERKGLDAREMVALSGSHTIGQARCTSFRTRIYDNSSNIDADFATSLRKNCPPNSPNGNNNMQPLDLVTPNAFDTNYFKNLVSGRGLLISDQALFNGDSTDSIVMEYVDNPLTFESDFAAAMVKMSELDVLTGANGIIRTLCNTAS
ncbi:hypothetical protein M8C21_029947 [Ambrosia artemisiifolia]|uniref:peroxidase n=1 Tax=Ambrosia artemisiifolia TaxID=4212 RepID=A0AAD5CDX8_AMBAR|nr:hypothetical protein M8C21_029947 [Ambrosia artemisiifolia]